jgi:hypothetical protein
MGIAIISGASLASRDNGISTVDMYGHIVMNEHLQSDVSLLSNFVSMSDTFTH